jgi:threonine/homoserine/homoserine lactone efflux protein
MGQAIGQVLPLAVGVALSPVPIIAVVLMLVTARARVNGPAFLVGWLVGLGIVGAIVLLLADPAGATSGGKPATWVDVAKLVLGALCLLLALTQWRGRPRGVDDLATPKWMGAIDSFGPGKAFGAGAVLGGANPKNLLLAVAAATTIAGAGLDGGDEALAYLVFAVIGTIGVAAPVAIYLTMGARAGAVLERLKAWMARNNAVIMAVLLLVIGAKLVGEAISGFSA